MRSETSKGLIHVAGPYNHAEAIQACARCGATLRKFPASYKGAPLSSAVGYPEGALIEEGKFYQGIILTADGPTCEAVCASS